MIKYIFAALFVAVLLHFFGWGAFFVLPLWWLFGPIIILCAVAIVAYIVALLGAVFLVGYAVFSRG